jgi:two-component system, OmpR family, response regulator
MTTDRRVLYVEDDRVNVLLFEEVCRMAGGLDVASAGSGAEAAQMAAQVVPDLLVIDLHLPDTDGFELLRTLRTNPTLAAVPAFLCTADEPSDVEAEARAAGFEGCWSKPVDVQQLIAELTLLGAKPAP